MSVLLSDVGGRSLFFCFLFSLSRKYLNSSTVIIINIYIVNLKRNAFLKRKVSSLFLKSDTEELFIMSEGKVFQSVGAATEKDLAPYVFKLK